MPFTPAHVAAVLPALGRTAGRPGWTAALVAGSIAPDLPYFLPTRLRQFIPVDLSREATHSLLALPTSAAIIGVLVALLWDRVVEPVARDALPRRVAGRLLPPGPRAGWRDLPALYLLAVVGVATHDLWDTLTHPGELTARVALLREVVLGVPVWSWLQLLSSGLGLLAVALWAVLRLRHRPVHAVPRRADWLPIGVVAAAAASVAAGLWGAWRHRADDVIDIIAWYGVTRAGGAAVASLGLLCVVWWLVPGRSARR